VNSSPHTTRLLATGAVALLAFIGATQAGNAKPRPASSFYTPQALKAMSARYEAQARFYAHRPASSFYTTKALYALGAREEAKAEAYANRPASSFYTPQALKAMSARYEAQARAYEQAQLTKADDGFGWTNAGIGSGVFVGLLILGGVATLTVRKRPRRVLPL
jgi:hypothetical protein